MSAPTTADDPNTTSSINTSSMSATANDTLQNAKDTVVNSKVLRPIQNNLALDLIANHHALSVPTLSLELCSFAINNV
jgi:hypothetical protein